MKSGAKGRKLYSFLLTAKQDNSCNLVGRCQDFCQKNEMSLYRYLLDDSYCALCKRNLKASTRDNGLFDTLSFYMKDFKENRDIVSSFIVDILNVPCLLSSIWTFGIINNKIK